MPRAQQYLDVVSVIVVAIRRDETVELINRRGCEALGLSEAELVGRNWFDVALPVATREPMRTRFGQVMRGEVQMVANNAVIELITARGPRTFAWTSDILRDASGAVTGMLSSGEDITDRRRLAEEELAVQARLLAGQKLESLGLLASGIAHDFNNLLLGVRGHAELVAADGGLAAESRDSLRQILDAASIAAGLVRQLLDFAGQGPRQTTDLDLATHTAALVTLLRAALPKSASITLAAAADLPAVRADPEQLQQLIMNLVINAAEAYEGRPGVVAISLEPVTIDATWDGGGQPLGALPPGDYLRLSIRDRGVGMDAVTLARVFDPFFTTKAHGRGLGLAAALGIVRSSGAHIDATSTPGEGTRFDVWFPALAAAPAPRARRTSTLPPLAVRAPETTPLLVVDDEPLVRRFTARALERAGYQVLVAGGGAEAEAQFAAHPGIALVVLDVNMPEMDGHEVARRLRARSPGLPVLFQSGLPCGELDDNSRFLAKPYSQNALLATVSALLGGPPR